MHGRPFRPRRRQQRNRFRERFQGEIDGVAKGPLASHTPLTPALLKLDPMFDPLRNDSRFKAWTESSAASGSL